jgi:cell division protein FtsQ
MPPEFEDPEGDGVLRPTAARFGASRRRWWWPASTAGRAFLSLAALTVLGALTFAGLVTARFLERDARFRIAGTENIQAAGLSEVSRSELLPVFGEDIGRNIFFVPLGERRRQLEQIPWVERATVMRVLPDRIRIEVVERHPIAFTRHGQQIGLVDADGVLLTMAPKTMAERNYSFPVLTGIDAGDSPEARKRRMAVYQQMMAELDAGGKHDSEQISEVDLTDPEDARVLMPDLGADILVHLGNERFSDRFERYKANIAEWRQQYPKLRAVDLRFDHNDEQTVLQMANDSGVTPSPAAAPPEMTPGKSTAQEKVAAKTVAKPALPAANKPVAKEAAASKSVAKKSKPAQEKKQAATKRTAAKTASKPGKRTPAPAARTAAAATKNINRTQPAPATAAPASRPRFTVTPASAVVGGG